MSNNKTPHTAASISAAKVQEAANKVLQRFVTLEKRMPDKRAANLRIRDFVEIYGDYDEASSTAQAGRCLQCGVPFCQVHCPLHNHIPEWLKMTAEGRFDEAYVLAQSTNSMPEICGRICPQDRLCESNCVIEKNYQSVSIGAVERYITDRAWEEGIVPPIVPKQAKGQSVGIIGAGPGGLAAAEILRQEGYDVHVYDRYDRAGGLLIYGIPGFKLAKDVVTRRIDRMVKGGIIFHLNSTVGEDISFAELRSRHDALLIATGVYRQRTMDIKGENLAGVIPALDYLIASNRAGLGDKIAAFKDGKLNASNKKVVVIGGGDTAMDCVRTAIRQGAIEVRCLYRRDRANMPGSLREVINAEEEGVIFEWLAAPELIKGYTNEHFGAAEERATGIVARRMRLGLPDATGRRVPELVKKSSFTIEADLVITALGFDPENLPVIFETPELHVTRWGTIEIDAETQMTSIDGVFAVGDIVRGASLVVWAIYDGRRAARSMDIWLKTRECKGQAGYPMPRASSLISAGRASW